MLKNFLVILFSLFAFGLFAAPAAAQWDASTPTGRPRQEEPLPKNVLETLKKGELEQLKKDYEKMLKNGEEAVRLSEEVEESFKANNKFTSTDIEKLKKIENLLKNIRKELGGGSDIEEEEEAKKPDSLENAVSTLRETTAALFDELKKTSRYSISVVAIQSSNSLLNVIRYIKFWKK